jgi:hypothetical protein
MKRPATPKPSTAAQALLEAGREHPPLRYDVEAGLTRHQQHVQNATPMPPWASARGALPGSALTWRIVKFLIAGAVLGPLLVVLWPAREPPAQPAPERAAAPVATPALGGADTAASPAPPEPDPRTRAPETPARARRPANGSTRRSEPRVSAAPASTEAAPEVPSAASVTETAQPELPDASSFDAPGPRAGPVQRTRSSRQAPEQRSDSRDRDEVSELALAERLLTSAPQRALALARSGDARFPNGYLRQERAYVAIIALTELGAFEQARTEAERFFSRYANTPYDAQIRRALEAAAADASPR